MITGLFHAGFIVSDIERSIAWYREVLGMEVAYRVSTTGEGFGKMTGLPPKPVAHLTDLRRFRVDHRHDIVYTQDLSTDPVRFFINGKQFDPNRVDQVMHLGKIEQWTIHNRSDEWHTFHIHVNDFQVTNVNGRPVRGVYVVDNIEIAPFSTGTMLTRPTLFTGKFVFHCHVLGHEDLGMMATVQIKP